jgi:hypothetical protein
VICACRDRKLPFRLAAGLRHALRHTDPETGFTHHGFLNVLVAAISRRDGARWPRSPRLLAATHPVPLVEPARCAATDRGRCGSASARPRDGAAHRADPARPDQRGYE